MMGARIQIPPSPKAGEEMEVRILIQHPMETGFRHEMSGATVPKNVIQYLKLEFNTQILLEAELGTGTAANPFLQFKTRVFESGWFVLNWVDDAGVNGSERALCTLRDS
jgi:sulfur-oxidizing protein SoxZ